MLAMAETKNEIIKSKQYTPFLLPEWVRQHIYFITCHFSSQTTIKGYSPRTPIMHIAFENCICYNASRQEKI